VIVMVEVLVALFWLSVWTAGGLMVAMLIGQGRSGGMGRGSHRLYAIAFLLTGFVLLMFSPEVEHHGARITTLIWASICIVAFVILAVITARNLHKYNKEHPHEHPDPD
jgi:hypothetical protein